jgi:hypothetical protein
VLEEPTQALPVLGPLMTRGQEARSGGAPSGADIVNALDLPQAHPPWSGWCWYGQHDRCNGTAPPADRCYCRCHQGERVT